MADDEADDSGLGMDSDNDPPRPARRQDPVNDDNLIEVNDEPDVIVMNNGEEIIEEFGPENLDNPLAPMPPCDICLVSYPHEDEVYAVDIHTPYVVSGCKDDTGRIWDMRHVAQPPQPVFIHKCQDSVIDVAFSSSGDSLAMGAEATVLKVVSLQGSTWTSHDEAYPGASESLSFVTWHPSEKIILYGCDEMDCVSLHVEGRPPVFIYGQSPPEHGCFDLPSGARGYSAFKDSEIVSFDGMTGRQLGKARTPSAVSSMHAANALLAVGLESGVLQVRQGTDNGLKVLFETETRISHREVAGEADDTEKFVEAVLVTTSPSGPLVISANGTGHVAAWDISRKASRWDISNDCGATRMVAAQDSVFIGFTDGKILQIGSVTGALIKRIQAHPFGTPVTDLALDQEHLVTAGLYDGLVKVWNLPL